VKVAEIREMGTEALHAELERLRRHLFDLRAQAVTEKLHNPNQMTEAKRDIARVLTVLTERGVEGIEEHQRHMEAVARTQGAAQGAQTAKKA
jgi:large subunit ribosomal protein L29